MRSMIVAAAAALLVFALTSAASAKSAVVYSISLDQAAPAYGDLVTFTYAPDPVVGNVNLSCYQGGTLVSTETHAANAEGWSYHRAFTLGGTYLWTSGSADCVAQLLVLGKNKKEFVAASTSFTVSG